MTEQEVRRIVHQTVLDTLASLGLDTSSTDKRINLQKNFAFLDSWRTSTETVKKQGIIVTFTAIISGILGLIWLAVTKNGGPN